MRCGVIIGSTIHTNFYIMRKEKEIIHIVLILSLIDRINKATGNDNKLVGLTLLLFVAKLGSGLDLVLN